jgi:hypothetical protein
VTKPTDEEMGGRWHRAPGVVTRRVAGELVLVPVAGTRQQRDTRFFVLNDTAERLWSLMEEPRSADELAQHLTTEFEVDAARARADVAAFLADLDSQGAIIRG